MAKKSVGRSYGVRYGSKNRTKTVALERQYRQKQKCPHCAKIAVKRLSPGIFVCTKCEAKFTGRAYTAESSIKKVEEVEQ